MRVEIGIWALASPYRESDTGALSSLSSVTERLIKSPSGSYHGGWNRYNANTNRRDSSSLSCGSVVSTEIGSNNLG